MSKSTTTHLIVAVTYDRLGTFEFGCVTELFALPRPELDVDWYRFAVCSVDPGPVQALGGVRFEAPHTLEILEQADTIIIPGWRDPDEMPPETLLRALRAAYARGARLCSICSGAFVLGWAGVLDGKKATTHWRLVDQFRNRFPSIDIQARSLYIDADQILTSAGSAAGLDMMLYMVAKDYGWRIANLVAQRLIVAPRREGGQAQFIARPLAGNDSSRMGKLLDWMRSNLAHDHSLESLARRAAMSPRTLQRQFRESTGLPPYEWLLQERISLAKELLQSTHAPIVVVGERAGFGSEASFRHHFRRVAGISPASYRRSFASMLPGQAPNGKQPADSRLTGC